MTIDEARDLLLAKGDDAAVIYRPDGEDGVITSVSDRWVFVDYGTQGHSEATDPADLELLAATASGTRKLWKALGGA